MDQGLDRVTMRRLAEELDTGPASLYVYFRNVDELYAAILDEKLGEVDLTPASAPGDWRDRLIQILTSYIQVLYAHPALARSALVARPRGENYFDLIEALLSLLHEGGVTAERAAWGLDVLLQFATSTAAEHGTRNEAANTAQEWGAFLQALSSTDAARRPYTAAAVDDLVSGTPDSRLTWSLLVLLNGILTAPAP